MNATSAQEPPQQPNAPEPEFKSSQLTRRLALGIFAGLLVYAGFTLWADVDAILAALRDFNLWLLPLAMALSFTNYAVRFVRWERYRTLLGIELERGTSFTIYLSGLALTVTPGKMGEAMKSWLIRRVTGTPIAVSAPIVVAERFTDLLAFLMLVAIGGLATQPDYAWIFWATLLLCAGLLACFCSKRIAALLCRILAKLPLIGGLAPRVDEAFASTRTLMQPRELIMPTIVSTLGWGLECLGFWFIADALVPGVPLLFAIYAFALSAVAGAVLILFPGGLGVTEGTLVGLLASRYKSLGIAHELALPRATSATILIRLCTLWFAVAVGLIAFGHFQRTHRAD